MAIQFLTKTFPANDATDGQFLYRSLGSFWTRLFSNKNMLKGYTIGMAEELIQAYYTLIETINQYSVKDIPLLHKEKWHPLKIKKSEFNKTKFIFEKAGAVFGLQSETDPYYPSSLFRFGTPKETAGTVYSFQPKDGLVKFGAIADRVISPALLLLPGVDVIADKTTLFFNKDLFNEPNIPKVKLVGDLGESITYIDSDGSVVEDEYIILWCYEAEIDNEELYKNFGVLFDIQLPTSKSYKELLKTLMNMSVEGPTIATLSSAFASLCGVQFIIEPHEIVEDVYSDDLGKYIITDRHVYRVESDRMLSRDVKIGARLQCGQILTDDIKFLDTCISGDWWNKEIKAVKLGFSSHIFLAGGKNQLFLDNSPSIITYTRGKLNFPIGGRPEDVTNFQKHINAPVNRVGLVDSLGLHDFVPVTIEDETILEVRKNADFSQYVITDHNAYYISRDRTLLPEVQEGQKILKGTNLVQLRESEEIEDLFSLGESRVIDINPMDFIFKTILKNNTALLKLAFYSSVQIDTFFKLLPLIKNYLPPHVYILLYMNYNIPKENWENFNNGLRINEFPTQYFSLDGSLRNGRRPGAPGSNNYYKDYKNRLFCVSISPQKNGEPLHSDNNLDTFNVDNSLASNNSAGIRAGKMRTEIPESITPSGQTYTRRPSTREIQSILLIDF
jgi:hypothetical protein